ncbi:DeoR/GlpR family DNA-binding transcription regulator [Rugamonas sp. CCM 8940]|uniref:DeoR/GlpR family DNA-binding transcription regulator n=1 Tax=Rugamonas sp. CCM 8940 TaxID=2765359 RepID=UPI0018F4FD0F|nr:DeoR/GlpR family DNA-binding transcription regulator [Rugamonas sp. CCM 8940]MBJ7310201.1 DeoR/GlpR transcriptional regulator [Rugamonas sp. CCM 8940]
MSASITSISAVRLPEERQRLIVERLAGGGRVLAAELAREFGISEDTVRRDMRELAAAGLCERVYGGVLPLSPASGPLVQRQEQARPRKLALAAAALPLLRQGQLLLIDAGSTNGAIAELLPDNLGLSVATNSPAIAALLAPRRGIGLIVIGGQVDWRSGASLGARAVRDVAALRADLCFLGACSVDARRGIGGFSLEEAEFKQAAVAASDAVAVAVTNEKIGTGAPYDVAAMRQIAYLLVEHDADPARLASFYGEATQVRVADAA